MREIKRSAIIMGFTVAYCLKKGQLRYSQVIEDGLLGKDLLIYI